MNWEADGHVKSAVVLCSLCDDTEEDLREFVGEPGGVPAGIPVCASLLHGFENTASLEARRNANAPLTLLVVVIDSCLSEP